MASQYLWSGVRKMQILLKHNRNEKQSWKHNDLTDAHFVTLHLWGSETNSQSSMN